MTSLDFIEIAVWHLKQRQISSNLRKRITLEIPGHLANYNLKHTIRELIFEIVPFIYL